MQGLQLKLKGLYTNPNDLSAVPDGALATADNVVINRPDVAEPRRGFDLLRHGGTSISEFSDAAYRANRLFFYQSKLLAHYSTDKLAYHDATSGWTALSGSYQAPSGTKMRSAQANQNLYLTTSDGVYKLDAYNATPRRAGAPRGLDIQASLTGSSGFLALNYRAAYRVVWGYEDSNGNLVLGAPSQAESIKNTGATSANVSLTFTIPDGVTTSWFYQVYRTEQIDNSSSDVEPPEEYALVEEGNPDSTAISNGYVTITDITPDELRGTDLYTNVNSGEGIALANLEPPLCKDVAVFRGYTFFLNTTSKHRYFLDLIGVGSSNGLQLNDTLTVGGTTFTAKATATPASGYFRLYYPISFTFVDGDVNVGTDTITENAHGLQDGDPVVLSNSGGALPTGLSAATTYFVVGATANTFQLSTTLGGSAVNITAAAGGGTHTLTLNRSTSQNIRETARSLIHAINRSATATVYATYLSGPDDKPGMLLLEERSIGGSSFAVTSSRSTCWSPSLPTSGTTESSTNDAAPNGVSWSKGSQPEAVPLPYQLKAGSKEKAILRGIALRDRLIILKEDGVYSLTGTDPSNFVVEELDGTVVLVAPDSAVVLSNQIFCLSTQGVVSISDSSVQVRSWDIEKTLLELQGVNPSVLAAESFGVSYESERKYLLFVPSSAGDIAPTQCFVYNTFTNAWTRWPLSKKCGGVNPTNDRLYLGDADSNTVDQERKSYSYSDYVDYGFAATVSAVSGRTLTISLSDQIEEGDIVYQSSSVYSVVASVDTVAGTVTTESTASFTPGTVDVLKAISTRIKWAPISLGNPGILKQFTEVAGLFSQPFYGEAVVNFSTDLSPAVESETMTGVSLGQWGLFPWGQAPWGGSGQRRPYRVMVPITKQRACLLNVEFTHGKGYARYALNGLSIQANPGTFRTGR